MSSPAQRLFRPRTESRRGGGIPRPSPRCHRAGLIRTKPTLVRYLTETDYVGDSERAGIAGGATATPAVVPWSTDGLRPESALIPNYLVGRN